MTKHSVLRFLILGVAIAQADITKGCQPSPTTEPSPAKGPRDVGFAKTFEGSYTVVFINAQTEERLGRFPFDRALYALAVDRAIECGAKGLVIKLLLDVDRGDGDRILADSISRTAVVLEAALSAGQGRFNTLPRRFEMSLQNTKDDEAYSADVGIVPLPLIATFARDVGFSDNNAFDRAPIVEKLHGHYVKSALLCCLELAAGSTALVQPAKSVELLGKIARLDGKSQLPISLPAKQSLPEIEFDEFLNSKNAPDLKGRVVLIAYDGNSVQPLQTPFGALRPHRFFCLKLRAAYDVFKVESGNDATPAKK